MLADVLLDVAVTIDLIKFLYRIACLGNGQLVVELQTLLESEYIAMVLYGANLMEELDQDLRQLGHLDKIFKAYHQVVSLDVGCVFHHAQEDLR